MEDSEREVVSGCVVKCKGNVGPLKQLEEPAYALLRVFSDGEVRVNCTYLDDYNRSCMVAGMNKNKRDCMYRERK